MRIGLSSYTYVWEIGVEGYPRPARPLTARGLLERAAGLGVRLVQIADNLPLDALSAAERRETAREAGHLGVLVEVGTRGIRPPLLDAYLAIAQEFGSPVLRTLIDSAGHEPEEEEIVATLRAAAPVFEKAGVTLAIENHDRFRAVTLDRILERVGSPSVGICLDTANSLGCGEGISQVMDALAPRVVNLHIKDFVTRRLPHGKGLVVEGCPAGRGLVDIPEVIDRLRKAGRDPNAIIELWTPPEADGDATVAKEKAWGEESVRYMRALLGPEP